MGDVDDDSIEAKKSSILTHVIYNNHLPTDEEARYFFESLTGPTSIAKLLIVGNFIEDSIAQEMTLGFDLVHYYRGMPGASVNNDRAPAPGMAHWVLPVEIVHASVFARLTCVLARQRRQPRS